MLYLYPHFQTKCHRYWPGSLPEVYGDVTVEMLSEKENNDWITRKFELSKVSEDTSHPINNSKIHLF